MLNRSGKWTSYLILDLRGKAFNFSPLSISAAGFLLMSFLKLRNFYFQFAGEFFVFVFLLTEVDVAVLSNAFFSIF